MADTVEYNSHRDDDKINILFCEIKIWQPETVDKWMEQPTKYIKINEVISVEIHKSYKQLISTAIIQLPRGAVMSVVDKTEDDDGVVSQEVINKEEINVSVSDTGVIQVHKNSNALVQKANLAVGQRIEIRLAYVDDDEVFDEWMRPNSINKGDRVFTGWITKCSVDEPLKVECEDILSMLKKKQCPNIAATHNFTVNELMSAEGKYKLLEGTGITLDKITQDSGMNVGMIPLTDNLVVADVLTEWSKCGLFAFLNDKGTGTPTLRIGRVYSSLLGNDDTNVVSNGTATNYTLMCNWDVAEDKLKVLDIDKHYLAVQASAQRNDGRFVKLTIRPKGFGEDVTDFDVVNFKEPKKKSNYKSMNGNQNGDETIKENADLEMYTIVPYFSPNVYTSKEKLVQEAKQFWGRYNKNGMEGSLKIFGDVDVYPTCSIGLIDPRAQKRNGLYFIESVDINFDTSGYRKEIKLPYRILKYGEVEIQ